MSSTEPSTGVDAGASIDARLAAAGLPPLPRTAWLALDLDALAGNLAVVRDLAGPAVPVHPVVKADAYGHGAVPIARALEAAGADGFCVAALDEALALRAGGIRAPIRVLYPIPPSGAADAATAEIAVAVGDPAGLDALLVAVADGPAPGAEHGAVPRPALQLELEVETGLGRGGVLPADLVALVERLLATPGVRLTGLWTHLQASEDEPRTTTQLAVFDAAAAAVRAAGHDLPTRHVAASGGLLTDVVALDGVRPGLLVYGLVPDELDEHDLPAEVLASVRPVLSLHARPVRVVDLPTGHGVSYGPTWTAPRPSRIATLPLGYGDGFSRAFSNRAAALVRGRRVPSVGNVAMDATMVDVTDVPGPPVTIDDTVTLIGSQGGERITVGELARLRNTNQWEVVTAMARRLPRVYHSPAAPVGLRTLIVEAE
ncbi:MAG TPA: alanine racemase [Candidatus Saccharimonadales bacterium]|nr:alanine racemase [Candidatus Saccharimonadales bacterium]